MEVTFKARIYSPEAVRTRYVRANIKNGDYSWCEVGSDPRWDLRQGLALAEEIPEEIRAAADALRGTWPGYVEWPIS